MDELFWDTGNNLRRQVAINGQKSKRVNARIGGCHERNGQRNVQEKGTEWKKKIGKEYMKVRNI